MDIEALLKGDPLPVGTQPFAMSQGLIDVIDSLSPGGRLWFVTPGGREVSIVLSEDLDHIVSLTQGGRP